MENFDGQKIIVGERVRPIYWGGSVNLSDCGNLATVVGFGRKNVRIQYDGKAYGGRFSNYDLCPPRWLRRADPV